jgi:hypothetical protein
VDELERLGYVRRRSAPSDRRAKRVVPTQAARAVIDLVREVNETIERRFRVTLGEHACLSLRRSLMSIVPGDRALIQPRMTPVARGGPSRRGSGPEAKRNRAGRNII